MSDRQKQSRLLLSEREKKRRNPTYARLQRKIFLESLPFLLIPAALLCLGVSFEGIASQVIFLLFLVFVVPVYSFFADEADLSAVFPGIGFVLPVKWDFRFLRENAAQ